MTKNVTRRLLTATVSTGVLASALVFGAQSAQASVGSSIINIASANLNNGPCSTNSAGGSGYYNSCSEAWCADFAKWVWAQDGVNVSGLTAGAGSFAQYGSGLHSTPHVGDAAVFNYNGNGYADHVALVASVNTDGTVSTIGGNQSNRVTWGKITASGYYGSQKVSGYVTPIGGRDDNPAPAQTTTWKAQVLVNGGGGIYHAIRDSSGNWSSFANIASQAGDIGTVGSIADAGINGETHVVAVGGDGKLYHAIRHADGTWAGFGDVNAQAGALSGAVTKVSAVSVGGDLHVLAV
ncbi:CHAP domain-containing protein, partial [Kitasatospora cineracea]